MASSGLEAAVRSICLFPKDTILSSNLKYLEETDVPSLGHGPLNCYKKG